MKHLAVILVLLAAAFSVRAEDVPGMAAFLKEVTAACERQDVKRLQSLQYEAGAAPEMQQANSARWAYVFSGSYPEAGWHFDKVTFTPLESLAEPVSERLFAPTVSEEGRLAAERANDARKEVFESVTKPLSVKGKLYEHNLKVLGFACIMFAKDKEQSGMMFPVGVDPEGRVRFALLRPVEKEASPRP
ncbi:MAG: hypothetical protein BGO12_19075 [Verrucomicrobia bacterium 61-8]|nr:hypothetical protein [Verrucomicrobiota bacterium]OJV00860.1 MAG: hypothetical protein BGO12_19075 [Verrucomicrobia bacterium 61-8]